MEWEEADGLILKRTVFAAALLFIGFFVNLEAPSGALAYVIISIVLVMANVLILKNSENISTGSFMVLALSDALSIFAALVISPFLIIFKKSISKKKRKNN